jgi:hypothetical protein
MYLGGVCVLVSASQGCVSAPNVWVHVLSVCPRQLVCVCVCVPVISSYVLTRCSFSSLVVWPSSCFRDYVWKHLQRRTQNSYSNIIANILVVSVWLCPSLLSAEALDIEACYGLQA